MLTRIIDLIKNKIFPYVILFSAVYLIIASFTFAFRHPWATDMDRLIHIGDALMFKKISYKEMRGDYEK